MALVASFVRHRGARDHIYVRRSNGTTCDWAFPTYGDQLPHDLCHLVIEQSLKMADGFWGLVEDGLEVALVDDQGTLMKDGRPLSEHVDVDCSGLVEAEEAVALLSPTGMEVQDVGALAVARVASGEVEAIGAGVTRSAALGFHLPPSADASTIATIRERLLQLGHQWRRLADGEAITIEYVRPQQASDRPIRTSD